MDVYKILLNKDSVFYVIIIELTITKIRICLIQNEPIEKETDISRFERRLQSSSSQQPETFFPRARENLPNSLGKKSQQIERKAEKPQLFLMI